MDEIPSLLKQYEDSEQQLAQARSIYEKFEETILQDRMQDVAPKSSEPVSSNKTGSLRGKNLTKRRSGGSLNSNGSFSNNTSSSSNDCSSNVFKSVEKRIHQIENYRNLLNQKTDLNEKALFLKALNT
ncbi:unnamed protein product [Ceutorhynchus assimilis]|uniref:Uncharacterized protein n=1 Tax=Ceutorhynchus assimilis TaxID=467358 RepID=A0A9N9MN91_9CUCU|nr:unnamed protein product [Ceutorhynchus assimilis]